MYRATKTRIVRDTEGRVRWAVAHMDDGREVFFQDTDHRELCAGVSVHALPSWGKWVVLSVLTAPEDIVIEINARGIPGLLYWATFEEYLNAVGSDEGSLRRRQHASGERYGE